MEKTQLGIPLAIIIAGIFVAGAVFFVNRGDTTNTGNIGDDNDEVTDFGIPIPQPDDHILGNPNADVIIVEYSDTECPYCKNFHNTMNRIMDEYGKDGRVAWVYRHFPLTTIHPKSQTEAEATECAAELGGNDGFWNFTNRLYEVTPSNNDLDLDKLPVIAEEVGLNRTAFEECLESERHEEKVRNDFDEARAAGGQGTPFSFFLLSDGRQFPMEGGAWPYENVKQALDVLLEETAATEGETTE